MAPDFIQSAAVRSENRARLDALADQIISAVPGTALASDQPYRDLDLAIDFCEDVPALDDHAIDSIVAAFDAAGATSKVSSIHVNGWFGDFNKLEGVRRFHHDRFGSALDPSRWAFFGDSANAEGNTIHLGEHSIGVANVADFLPRMTHHPTWVTKAPGGHGFIEGMRQIFPTQ